MLVLGLESSCDESAAAVVDSNGRVFSDVVLSQELTHAKYQGVVPELASRDHAKNMVPVTREALTRAGVSLADIDAVAVTHRPGLVGALLVGVQFAKGIAWGAQKPLVGVDHLMGHLLATFLTRGEEGAPPSPIFPFVALLASGGHTAIYRVDGPVAAAVRELGGTRDDAVGEAFDKVAKMLGLGYPGGPVVDRWARLGNPDAVALKAPMARSSSPEMSFSGIKTQVAERVRAGKIQSEQEKRDLCASFQRSVTTVLASKLVAAALSEGVKHVVLGGGVAANSELRRRVSTLAAAHALTVHLPVPSSCTDNAAMIAYAGAQRLAVGERDDWALLATSQTVFARRTLKGGGKRSQC